MVFWASIEEHWFSFHFNKGDLCIMSVQNSKTLVILNSDCFCMSQKKLTARDQQWMSQPTLRHENWSPQALENCYFFMHILSHRGTYASTYVAFHASKAAVKCLFTKFTTGHFALSKLCKRDLTSGSACLQTPYGRMNGHINNGNATGIVCRWLSHSLIFLKQHKFSCRQVHQHCITHCWLLA